MSYFLKTLTHAINGTGETAKKKRRGKQTLSKAGFEVTSLTQISFSINNRTKGNVSHSITFLTISKSTWVARVGWLPRCRIITTGHIYLQGINCYVVIEASFNSKFTFFCYLPNCQEASVTRWCVMDVPGSIN